MAPRGAPRWAPGVAETRRGGSAGTLEISVVVGWPLELCCYTRLAGPGSSRRSSWLSVVRRSTALRLALSAVALVSRCDSALILSPLSAALCGSLIAVVLAVDQSPLFSLAGVDLALLVLLLRWCRRHRWIVAAGRCFTPRTVPGVAVVVGSSLLFSSPWLLLSSWSALDRRHSGLFYLS